jgi:CBS domain-containing protein
MTEDLHLDLRAPLWAPPETTLADAAARMLQAGTSSILVGSPGELVSILTERDLAQATAMGLPSTAPVLALAVPDPHTVPTTATVREAAVAMLEHGIRHLVVAHEGRAVGVVSMRDLVAALVAALPGEPLVAFGTRAAGPHPEHWWG